MVPLSQKLFDDLPDARQRGKRVINLMDPSIKQQQKLDRINAQLSTLKQKIKAQKKHLRR